jgi:hypothetical protein
VLHWHSLSPQLAVAVGSLVAALYVAHETGPPAQPE